MVKPGEEVSIFFQIIMCTILLILEGRRQWGCDRTPFSRKYFKFLGKFDLNRVPPLTHPLYQKNIHHFAPPFENSWLRPCFSQLVGEKCNNTIPTCPGKRGMLNSCNEQYGTGTGKNIWFRGGRIGIIIKKKGP